MNLFQGTFKGPAGFEKRQAPTSGPCLGMIRSTFAIIAPKNDNDNNWEDDDIVDRAQA